MCSYRALLPSNRPGFEGNPISIGLSDEKNRFLEINDTF